MSFLPTTGFRLAAVACIQAQSWRTVLICIKTGWRDVLVSAADVASRAESWIHF